MKASSSPQNLRSFKECSLANTTRTLIGISTFLAMSTLAWGNPVNASDFYLESHPGADPIRSVSATNSVERIEDNTWIAFTNFDFGSEANHVVIEGATNGVGGLIELRTGSDLGSLIGTVPIAHTGTMLRYREFRSVLNTTVSGTQDLYLRFVDTQGTGGDLFNIRAIKVERVLSPLLLPLQGDADADGTVNLLEHVVGTHPQSQDSLPLTLLPNETATSAYEVEVRLRAEEGYQAKLMVSNDLKNWDEVSISVVNGVWQTNHDDIQVAASTLQADGLHAIQLTDTRTASRVFIQLAAETVEGALHVYPPVPGLAASEYYSFAVQKVSALNSENVADVTNWETPLAWFTRCGLEGEAPSAYYSGFIGGWTHTYCNFEMNSHTPIVVKITRLNKAGAPTGPITRAAVHPERKVDSWEIIDGEVYVTMSQPALIAVDIDGQMDTRDAPRALESGWNNEAFPYKNEMNGVHAVTIFANPIIEDKPSLDDPNVFAVEPGTLPPVDGDWTTLYFKPGIHKFSVDESGNEREWMNTDPHRLISNKNYYIPGDAIVYGNFHDYMERNSMENVRIFGHGTISGEKIAHWQDYDPEITDQDERHKLRMLFLSPAKNCVYEGITIADQAEHGIYIEGEDKVGGTNYIKWVKSITWRVNNDAMGVRGNSWIEDCFLRHQDDGTYVRGLGVRRTVYWSDVNGTPLRCSFITYDRNANYPDSLPQELVIEDIDIIYCRGVFAGSDSTSFAVISSDGGADAAIYADGTQNTAQHLVFRNITISDPRPVRSLFGFDADTAWSTQGGDWAGLRFENIHYQHEQVWGWKNRLLGSAQANIKYWTFDNVSIAGERVDQALINDVSVFETSNVSDLIFK